MHNRENQCFRQKDQNGNNIKREEKEMNLTKLDFIFGEQSILPNPSHLETVNPVTMGCVRAV